MLFISKTWLKVSMSARSHTKERAIVVVLETDGTRITQRKIHRGRTGLRKADKEWRGEMIF
jgi:hypothetical protein